MKRLMEIAVYVLGVLAFANGCSEPEGGFIEATPAGIVLYSDHVVVGEVTEIIRPDPIYGDMYVNSTYGAMVLVHCTYKGGPLTGYILIGAAGFVPGYCLAMELKEGQKYVLFLRSKDETEDAYEQAEPAVLKDELPIYLNVCGLHMRYPEENGMPLKRPLCPQPRKCQITGDENQPGTPDDDTVLPGPIDMQDEQSDQKMQPAVGQSGTDDNNTAMTVMTSLSAILLCIAAQLFWRKNNE